MEKNALKKIEGKKGYFTSPTRLSGELKYIIVLYENECISNGFHLCENLYMMLFLQNSIL